MPGGIRIRSPSKRAAADPRRGPRDHWVRLVPASQYYNSDVECGAKFGTLLCCVRYSYFKFEIILTDVLG
jgi:hypothetical protein